jgi:hypothetical protein
MACFCLFVIASLALLAMNIQAQTARGASVPAKALPDSLKKMDIKDHFIPSSSKKAGTIHALKGHVVIVHKGTAKGYFGVKGDTIYENDSLNTLADSRCRIKLFTGDVVTLAPDTELSLDTYLDQGDQGKKTSLFSMLKGKAKFYALRLLRYKESKFRVKTPTAVAGVRGTKFILSVYEKGKEKQAGAPVLVADAGGHMATYLAKSGAGANGMCTDAFVKQGCILLNNVLICGGQMVKCGGPVQLMPEDLWNRLDCGIDPDKCQKPVGKGGAPPGSPRLPGMLEKGTDTTKKIEGFKRPGPDHGHT